MTFPGEDDFLGWLGGEEATDEDQQWPVPDSADFLDGSGGRGEPDSPDDPAEVVRQQCAQWEETASSLRHSAPWPAATAPPKQVMDALVEVRSRLDRLELVYASAMALKAATMAQAKALEQLADDAWDDRANAERRTARREYEGPRERYAYWELDIRLQRFRARESRALADHAKGTCERVELAYRGLDGLRRDLTGRMTHLRWESTMEQ